MKIKYDVRRIDAWRETEGKPTSQYDWYWNSSIHYGEFFTSADNVGRALRNYLKREHGIVFASHRTYTDDDCGEVVTICSREDHEPLFCAVAILM